jgi:hypothetical protein
VYIVSYELFGRTDAVLQRCQALVPLLVVTIAYGVVSRAWGAGVMHSGAYVDPLAQPLRFLSILPERLSVMWAGVVLGVPIDVWLISSAVHLPLIALGVPAVALAIWAWRACAPVDDKLKATDALASVGGRSGPYSGSGCTAHGTLGVGRIVWRECLGGDGCLATLVDSS